MKSLLTSKQFYCNKQLRNSESSCLIKKLFDMLIVCAGSIAQGCVLLADGYGNSRFIMFMNGSTSISQINKKILHVMLSICFFFGHRLKFVWNDKKIKLSISSYKVWKGRLVNSVLASLMPLYYIWDKWLICVSKEKSTSQIMWLAKLIFKFCI